MMGAAMMILLIEEAPTQGHGGRSQYALGQEAEMAEAEEMDQAMRGGHRHQKEAIQ